MVFIVMGAMAVMGGRGLYACTGMHRPLVLLCKWTLRIALWLRGIRVHIQGGLSQNTPCGVSFSKKQPHLHAVNSGIFSPKALPEAFCDSPQVPKQGPKLGDGGIHICNNGQHVGWLLFMVLPYKSLVVMVDQLFSSGWWNPTLFLLGFYPKEHGVTPNMVADWRFGIAPYLAQGFGVWEPVYFEYRDVQEAPYVIKLAIQQGVPVHVWKVTGEKRLDKVSWLRRRVVKVSYITDIPMSQRVAVSMAVYEQTIETWFGPVASQVQSNVERAPGMPQSSKNLAKQTIVSSKKRSAVKGSEFPGL
jgi:hypothetical protein